MMESSCSFLKNSFCTTMPEQARESLCGICQTRRYARGQHLRSTYWKNQIALVTEGLAVSLEEWNHPPRTMVVEISRVGDFINLRELFHTTQASSCLPENTLCLTDCVVAVFDTFQFAAVMADYPQLTRKMLEDCVLNSLPLQRRMLTSLGFGSAEESVRFVLQLLNENQIDYLTHEQIALICNRSRQTVTTLMKKLTDEEPELFIRE